MARVFVLGVPCSGKSTIAGRLRRIEGLTVIDMDDEVVARNGGSWPDIAQKNEVFVPQVLDEVCAMDRVIVFNSYSLLEWTTRLREVGFTVVLLDVTEDEQVRRDERRFAAEGWTNREWFGWNRTVVADHVNAGLIDLVVDGTQSEDAVATALRSAGTSGL